MFVATQDQLQERDQKQMNFEDLSTYLQRLTQDRERLLHPGQHFGGSASLNISDFMADKMGEMKGNNLTQTRRERLTRLQFKLEEVSFIHECVKKRKEKHLGGLNDVLNPDFFVLFYLPMDF